MEATFPIMKLSGEYYLGMGVKHDLTAGIMALTHTAYITEMLAKFKMTDCLKSKPLRPQRANSRSRKPLVLAEAEAFFPHYRSAIGSLLWLARTTKPEIFNAVNQCNAHCTAPDHTHVIAVKRILRHCKGTIARRSSCAAERPSSSRATRTPTSPASQSSLTSRVPRGRQVIFGLRKQLKELGFEQTDPTIIFVTRVIFD
jgi:hypothetical protein